MPFQLLLLLVTILLGSKDGHALISPALPHRGRLVSLLSSPIYEPHHLGPSPDWFSAEMLQHGLNLMDSYHLLTGKHLIAERAEESREEVARALFLSLDRVVVSHGTQQELQHGPILNYGNAAALRRWDMTWEQLTTTPSRFTAEAMEREERAAFMKRVTDQGVVQDYAGVRISSSGKRFRIKNACVWNIVIDGVYLGQAATFDQWDEL